MNKAIRIAAMLIFALTTCGCATKPDERMDLKIHDIQGCTHRSPLEGKSVHNLQGIVTKKLSNGFVMQDSHADALDCSSEAIFVHSKGYSNVILGDLVSVNGRVAEFFPGSEDEHNLSQTEITDADVRVISAGNQLTEAVLLGSGGREFPDKIIEDDGLQLFDPETDGLDFYESMEWMLVKLPQMRVVGPRNAYNEIVVVEDLDSPDTPENGSRPEGNPAMVISADDRQPERLMIALGGDWQKKVDMGDRVGEGVVGLVIYSYGNYKIEVINQINLEKEVNTKSEDDCGKYFEKLRVAIYNLNNYSQYNNSSKIKAIAGHIALTLCTPDLVILNEVQDDSGESDDGEVTAEANLSLLTNEIVKRGGPAYRYYDLPPKNNTTGGVTGGNIRTVFLLRNDSPLKLASSAGGASGNGTSRVTKDGAISLTPNPMQIGFGEQAFNNSRKPLIGLFSYGSQQVIIIGLHLVSKGLDSPEYGSLQPIAEPELEKRIEQARYVNSWAEKILAKAPNTLVIIAGDMNDSYNSQVLDALQGDLFVDTAGKIPDDERYSIVMDGGASLFDHILVSNNVHAFTASIAHVNTGRDDASQTSDHDPVQILIQFPE